MDTLDLLSVATDTGGYMLSISVNGGEPMLYAFRFSDEYGYAPELSTMLTAWLDRGDTVTEYVPPVLSEYDADGNPV